MRRILISCLGYILIAPSVHCEPLFDDQKLDAFAADLVDSNNVRHYMLTSNQLAIHKWLTRECMLERGFEVGSDSNTESWNKALYGKYAYCQDHHIEGIDPPCPADEVVEKSVNSSCWTRAHIKIDWSSEIMNNIKSKLPDDQWRNDMSDYDIKKIETEWSACMSAFGFDYKSRFQMLESFSNTELQLSQEHCVRQNEDKIRGSAEYCFDTTDYYKKRKDLAQKRKIEYLIKIKDVVESTLQRYENAERSAEEAISLYCSIYRKTIAAMYEEEIYTDKKICSQK